MEVDPFIGKSVKIADRDDDQIELVLVGGEKDNGIPLPPPSPPTGILKKKGSKRTLRTDELSKSSTKSNPSTLRTAAEIVITDPSGIPPPPPPPPASSPKLQSSSTIKTDFRKAKEVMKSVNDTYICFLITISN